MPQVVLKICSSPVNTNPLIVMPLLAPGTVGITCLSLCHPCFTSFLTSLNLTIFLGDFDPPQWPRTARPPRKITPLRDFLCEVSDRSKHLCHSPSLSVRRTLSSAFHMPGLCTAEQPRSTPLAAPPAMYEARVGRVLEVQIVDMGYYQLTQQPTPNNILLSEHPRESHPN